MLTKDLKDPVRSINSELLERLEVVSTHVSPLQGGTGRRIGTVPDSRLTKLQGSIGEDVTYYEHIASIRDKKTGQFYVAFRETPDALFARSQDLEKYPEWLMKTKEKINECMIFIYKVYRHPSTVAVVRSHEDWLTQITEPSTFDTVVYFLSRNSVISLEQYQRF